MKLRIQFIIIALLMIFVTCSKKENNPASPTPSTVTIIPKLGDWSTGEITIGANSTLTINFPVSLENGKYSLYYGSYLYHIGGQIIGGSWGDITETDTFSTSQNIPGGDRLTIDGRFTSSIEAEGTISYTGLPTVEWTATWKSE